MDPALPARYLLELLFDPARRAAHAADPMGAARAFGLDPTSAASMATIAPAGLEADAELRRRYLMTAACRSYPLGAGALGAAPGGAARLAAFLHLPEARAGAAPRQRAMGAHLAALLEADPMGAGPAVTGWLSAYLAWERGMVQTAQDLREAIAAGAAPPPPPPARPRRSGRAADRRDRAPLRVPPHLIVAVLPGPPEVLRAALHGLRGEDAWMRIRGGDLSWARVLAVARAEQPPVTVLARAVAVQVAPAPPQAVGVPALVEVRHRVAELAGPAPGLLRQLDGTVALADLPPRQAELARTLLDAGLLDLAPT